MDASRTVTPSRMCMGHYFGPILRETVLLRHVLCLAGGLSAGMHWPIDEEDEGGTVDGMASIPDRATFIGSNGEGIAAGATVASVTEAAAAEQAATTGAFFCHVPHSEEKDDATNQGSDGPTAVSGCASPAPIAWGGAPPLRLPSNPFDDQGLQENITAGTIAPTTYMVHNGRQELALLCSSGASLIDRGLCLLQHTSAAAPHLLSATRAPPLAWAASSASSRARAQGIRRPMHHSCAS